METNHPMMDGRQSLQQLLLERGLVSPEELNDTLAEHQRTGHRLGAMLVQRGLLTEAQLMPVLAE